MKSHNDIPLRERSLSQVLREADQLLQAERAEILASENLHRFELKMLRRLARRADAKSSVAAASPVPASPTSEDATDTDETFAPHGRRGRGHLRHKVPFIRHLLMRGWVARIDGRPALTEEGHSALARIEDRLATVNSRLEAALTPEQCSAATEALATIVESFGGDDHLNEVRRRKAIRRKLRMAGGHPFGPRSFDQHPFGPNPFRSHRSFGHRGFTRRSFAGRAFAGHGSSAACAHDADAHGASPSGPKN